MRERLVVAVEVPLLDIAIGLESARPLPVLAQAEIDQLGRGRPEVKQHIHLAAGGRKRSQFQAFLQHKFPARLVDQIRRPRAFAEEVCQRFGIQRPREQAGQAAEGFALIAHDQGVHDLQQMSYLRLAKCRL
jgi:hypothetical protein